MPLWNELSPLQVVSQPHQRRLFLTTLSSGGLLQAEAALPPVRRSVPLGSGDALTESLERCGSKDGEQKMSWWKPRVFKCAPSLQNLSFQIAANK